MKTDDAAQKCFKELKTDVFSLEMELTESIVDSLQQRVQQCREQVRGNLPAIIVLQGMAAMFSHVRRFMNRSHVGAIEQIRNLLQTLELTLTSEEKEEVEEKTATALEQLLAWQQTCPAAAGETNRQDRPAPQKGDELGTVIEQEIQQTKALVREELAEVRSTFMPLRPDIADDAQLSSIIAEHVSALQGLFQEEIGQLREELQREKATADE